MKETYIRIKNEKIEFEIDGFKFKQGEEQIELLNGSPCGYNYFEVENKDGERVLGVGYGRSSIHSSLTYKGEGTPPAFETDVVFTSFLPTNIEDLMDFIKGYDKEPKVVQNILNSEDEGDGFVDAFKQLSKEASLDLHIGERYIKYKRDSQIYAGNNRVME